MWVEVPGSGFPPAPIWLLAGRMTDRPALPPPLPLPTAFPSSLLLLLPEALQSSGQLLQPLSDQDRCRTPSEARRCRLQCSQPCWASR